MERISDKEISNLKEQLYLYPDLVKKGVLEEVAQAQLEADQKDMQGLFKLLNDLLSEWIENEWDKKQILKALISKSKEGE